MKTFEELELKPEVVKTFEELELKPEILKAVDAAGYKTPMRIQAEAIPVALAGRDLIGCAQTGTGKTAAFTLPVLQRLSRGRRPQALVLAPTRELAIQIGDSIRKYGKYLPFKSATVYGGVDFEPQTRALRAGVDIIVATPGRLLDHMRRGHVDLGTVRHLILDEADRMLDMGFLPDVQQIINAAPNREQTMLFSATMPPEVRRLAERYMKEAVYVEASPTTTVAEGITHHVYPVPRRLKRQLLLQLLRDEPIESALIFMRTRRGADHLARYLKQKSMSVERLHSDRTQKQRQRALKAFRSGRIKMLVATDIAARGLDIPSVSHVFNYDIPECVEDYVHRAGRTARAEGTGFAVCLMAPEDIGLCRTLEAHLSRGKMVRITHPAFDYMSDASNGSHNGHQTSPANGQAPESRQPAAWISRRGPASPSATHPIQSAPKRPFGRSRARKGA